MWITNTLIEERNTKSEFLSEIFLPCKSRYNANHFEVSLPVPIWLGSSYIFRHSIEIFTKITKTWKFYDKRTRFISLLEGNFFIIQGEPKYHGRKSSYYNSGSLIKRIWTALAIIPRKLHFCEWLHFLVLFYYWSILFILGFDSIDMILEFLIYHNFKKGKNHNAFQYPPLKSLI